MLYFLIRVFIAFELIAGVKAFCDDPSKSLEKMAPQSPAVDHKTAPTKPSIVDWIVRWRTQREAIRTDELNIEWGRNLRDGKISGPLQDWEAAIITQQLLEAMQAEADRHRFAEIDQILKKYRSNPDFSAEESLRSLASLMAQDFRSIVTLQFTSVEQARYVLSRFQLGLEAAMMIANGPLPLRLSDDMKNLRNSVTRQGFQQQSLWNPLILNGIFFGILGPVVTVLLKAPPPQPFDMLLLVGGFAGALGATVYAASPRLLANFVDRVSYAFWNNHALKKFISDVFLSTGFNVINRAPAENVRWLFKTYFEVAHLRALSDQDLSARIGCSGILAAPDPETGMFGLPL